MRRSVIAFSILGLIGIGITGCSLSRFEAREPWREQAEQACLSQGLVTPSAYMSRSSPINGPGACGISYPFKITALAGGTVGLTQRATLGCPVIPRIERWLEEVVQPAAALYYGARVVEMKSGSYSCRPVNNQRGGKLSEHSFGNAVDVSAFRLSNGREIRVASGWKGDQASQEFLREVFVGACEHFTTVLGPGADPFHYDHFHLDLARHNPRGTRRVCKPILKFTPRIDRERGAVPLPPAQRWQGPSPDPLEIQGDDPLVLSQSDPQDGFSADLPPQGQQPREQRIEGQRVAQAGAPPPGFERGPAYAPQVPPRALEQVPPRPGLPAPSAQPAPYGQPVYGHLGPRPGESTPRMTPAAPPPAWAGRAQVQGQPQGRSTYASAPPAPPAPMPLFDPIPLTHQPEVLSGHGIY